LGIDWGLRMERYWETTPSEFKKYLEAYKKIVENKAREMDYSNFNLGKYLMLAYNDPKKYPKKPFLWKDERTNTIMTEEEMDRMMRRNTISLGGEIND
jgi:hypothetical protein